MKAHFVIILLFMLMITSCTTNPGYFDNFNNKNDRIWIGKEYWAVPLEDWRVENGKIHFTGNVPKSRVNLLTHVLGQGGGEFEASVIIRLTENGKEPGSAGFLIGLTDEEDPDIRAACYFGKGIPAGVSMKGYAFLNDIRVELPSQFDFEEFNITIKGSDSRVKMEVTDKNGLRVKDLSVSAEGINGLIAIAANYHTDENEKPGNSHFTFDDLKLTGQKVEHQPENSFGPILWTMYTLSNNQLKLMALLPPIGEEDNQNVTLQLRQGFQWRDIATEPVDRNSRTAVFRLSDWDASGNINFRVRYNEKDTRGAETESFYEGTIRREPLGRPLKLGALTCQYTSGYPYTPLINNLKTLEPDMLYFSGDQVYEPNGGYPIKREPEDVSILSYLGKYYMFGWAFGDLMRDRPTICTPDDHDVFHGNLWGEGGVAKPAGAGSSDTRGFMQSVEMVNVVNQTQCGHLPDPYDSTPAEQGMSVWYTGLTYGRVSFAIISDRIFKSGPEAVSDWEGRHDHMKEPREDLSFLDGEGVEMIGDRQIRFLNDWIMDWKDADMKALLSQTVFANVATHHGSLENYLYGDLDSGGWPKTSRDSTIRLMRKAGAIHINGDQHLPTLMQYGLNDYRDAGWSFNTPAICNFYMRWFLPDETNVPVSNRPIHGYPNTGNYEDAFGNKNYVYAVGNPGKITIDKNSRYSNAQLRVSGFGMVTFDTEERTIEMDAWRFLADVKNPNPIRDQFPGWPLKISQFDNLGFGAEYILPAIAVNENNQVIQIINEESSQLVNVYRMKGDVIQPAVFEDGTYTVIIGENENTYKIENLKAEPEQNSLIYEVELGN